jgi:hypothetical protein
MLSSLLFLIVETYRELVPDLSSLFKPLIASPTNLLSATPLLSLHYLIQSQFIIVIVLYQFL